MRQLLERYRSARVAVVVAAACCSLALAQAAAASNAIDMREVFRAPAPEPSASHAPDPRADGPARSLRITLRPMRDDRRRTAERKRTATRLAAHRKAAAVRVAVLPPVRDSLFQSVPQKPAIVSIYEDQTLRRGDAVVMTNGLHVFRGQETGLHRPMDFILLSRAASVDWRLRKTLSAFENNPPDHWRS